jgi:hypothetical protein
VEQLGTSLSEILEGILEVCTVGIIVDGRTEGVEDGKGVEDGDLSSSLSVIPVLEPGFCVELNVTLLGGAVAPTWLGFGVASEGDCVGVSRPGNLEG